MSPPTSPDTHMAFSSFAHIPDLQSLEFAVVLREEGNGEDIVSRMLPMSRIVPGAPVERKVRDPPVVMSVKEPCTRPECVAQRNRIQEMEDANEMLQEQLDDIEGSIRREMSKMESVEKANKTAEAANDELETAMNELDQKSAALEIEAEEGQRQKRDLHKKVQQLEAEIESFRKQTEERNRQREMAMASNQVEVVFAPQLNPFATQAPAPVINDSHGYATRPTSEREERLFVASLDLWDTTYGGSATKQSDFLSQSLRPRTTPNRTFRMPTPPYLAKARDRVKTPNGGKTKGRLRDRAAQRK
ncbi:hypothetical protein TeGR_g11620 [Tetraparma gracilis]|uniref:Uncharacterized protein n=1 Tax=Tetraparma gracilis TaxID=2962635 RepID=A0ABQ6N5C1_9STRA|nr:hypothetical protein TeGR_g11620 [Tetraparma gracilis]